MSNFARHFGHADLPRWIAAPSLLRRLFAEWQLPGPDADTTATGLRLVIRNGYLNFYAKGQSVAKLSVCRAMPRLKVHEAYLSGDKRDGYRCFDWDQIRSLSPSVLDSWVANALGHAGEEKRFVDDLVSANAGTLDLEMGLPGDDRVTRLINGVNRKVAPRMDLVVVSSRDGGTPLLNFWEAKCADNDEVRAIEEREPPVLHQLSNYVAWLALPDRAAEVLSAYRNAAGTLLSLAHVARKAECEAIKIWTAVVDGGLEAIRQPGIVIGNYCPGWRGDYRTAHRTNKLARCAQTFRDNGHRDRIIGRVVDANGYRKIWVEEYDDVPNRPLPPLTGFVISG